MFELDKKYKRGRRTFLYILISKGWIFIAIAAGLAYLDWLIYFGSLRAGTEQFLAQHPDWFVTVPMLSEWLLLLVLSFLLVGYLRASVLYRNYKFMLDKHAVHLRRGLFYVRETTIPYHQISNVHIARPYHYRLLGLAKLDIVTAADRSDRGGTADADDMRGTKTFLMPIIDISVARRLSRQLLESSAKIRTGQPVAYIDGDDEEDDEETGEEETR
jgi:uncharacterized membrane protein YdbT with pleckstrin-like domain